MKLDDVLDRMARANLDLAMKLHLVNVKFTAEVGEAVKRLETRVGRKGRYQNGTRSLEHPGLGQVERSKQDLREEKRVWESRTKKAEAVVLILERNVVEDEASQVNGICDLDYTRTPITASISANKAVGRSKQTNLILGKAVPLQLLRKSWRM